MEKENIKLKEEIISLERYQKDLKYEISYYEVIMNSCRDYGHDLVDEELIEEYTTDKDLRKWLIYRCACGDPDADDDYYGEINY